MTETRTGGWSPSVYMGEMRPWPDSVHVVRGKTDETRRYVPELTCQRVNKPDQFFADDFGYSVDAYRCSVCNFRLDRITNYCPVCGARVTGGDDDRG